MSSAAPILLIAPRGMLGRAVVAELESRSLAFRALGRPELDLGDGSSVRRAFEPAPRAVINCAAYTDVDGAEADEAQALEINGRGVERLVAECDALQIPLVHFSTDYVFDGSGRAPYPVDFPTSPINAYGRSKLEGERHVRESEGAHLILRTSWLYAPWGKSFVRTIAKLAMERAELKVVDDQRGRPTSAEHLAASALALLEREARGVFHVTDGGECTWFELAQHIVAEVRAACAVHPCTSAEFPRPAPRPAYSVLDLSETERLLGPTPDWRGRVSEVLERLSRDGPGA